MEEERPSKSARKRQSDELQTLGEALIDLPATEFDALPLPDALREAVLLARRIRKHGGLHRQKQYIGKLMRQIDAEPIRAALAARDARQRTDARRFHRIEQWRDRIIEDGPAAISQLAAETRRTIDVAVLTDLAARARHERLIGAEPHAGRELFRILREALEPSG